MRIEEKLFYPIGVFPRSWRRHAPPSAPRPRRCRTRGARTPPCRRTGQRLPAQPAARARQAPAALEAYQTLSTINARAGLSLAEREAVQITAAATHGCGFCVAGHTAIATKKAGLDAADIEALRRLAPPADPRLAAVAAFTAAVIQSRGRVTDAELAAFRAAGFTDAQALDVVLGVALATL
ncbi:MAG: carboxymuconolactone decarboxylase family protein [Acetobacteraceae bacterium]|nr:carboxymuconolactone decarboxylase family protein [Acetobacteraceae bacterium]